jgi:integrase
MTVKQRGNNWQADFMVEGERHRRNFSTKEDATAWEALARQAIKHGKPVPELQGTSIARTTLSEACDMCYAMFWKGSKSEEKQIQTIRQLNKYFGPKFSINDITTQAIDAYILDLKKDNLSNGTINRKLAALSKVLRYAHELGKLKSMPVFHRQKEGQNRIRWITDQEEQLILDTLLQWGAYDVMDAAIVSIDTGIRHSEMCNIRKRDLSPEGLYIGRTKNGHPRLVPLTTRSRKVLETRAKTKEDFIFPHKTREWTRSTWERLRNHLELSDVVWHTFRHTTCSRLVQGGVPLPHVKEWMGHKTIITTMRYAHLAPKHLQEVVSVLER